ncbi:MAG: hypothetical protein SGI73_10185 [Chloroflexota bacterium]|nr:hypothetical protein [Chloroflexota bacterium]
MSFPVHFDDENAQKPPDQVKIELLEVVPYPDRFRLYIHLLVTPFQERPNLVLTAHDDADQIVTELNIIETMHHDMEFTMHIRNRDEPAGVYTLTAELFYETRNPPQDRMIESFMIPEANEGSVAP